MAGLFDGLEKLGIGNMKNISLYEKEDKDKAQQQTARGPVKIELEEKDMIYDKKCTCPICDFEFPSKVMKTGKAKLVKTDIDLRPVHEGIDSTKYDAFMCPQCGYAALGRYFNEIGARQINLIKENVSKNFVGMKFSEECYNYEEATLRLKMSLACATVKQGKASEKAYTCLKLAWLLRGNADNLDENDKDLEAKKNKFKEQEMTYLTHALEGFVTAMQSENFPICNMDATTLDYLMGAIGYETGKLEEAGRAVSRVLVSTSANNRVKDKARDLKDMIVQATKGEK